MFLRTVAAGQRRTSVAGTEHQRRCSFGDTDRRSSITFNNKSRRLSVFDEKTFASPYTFLGKGKSTLLKIPLSSNDVLSITSSKDSLYQQILTNNFVSKSTKSLDTSSKVTETRITFQVKGRIFETYEKTLDNFPDTLLGDKVKRDEFYNHKTGEYIINRCYHTFGAILFYYQSNGILSRPSDIDREEFLKEMEFYQIHESLDSRHRQEAKFIEEEQLSKILPKGKIRKCIWKVLEYHETTVVTQICFYFYLITSLIAIIVFCLETEPRFKSVLFWYPLETSVNILFTFEYILRLFASPCTKTFILSPYGIVDFSAVFPYYLNLLVSVAGGGSIGPLSIFTLLRVLRVFKLTRYNEGLRILMMTIYESLSHLRSLFVCIGITSLLFATVLYYIESDPLSTGPNNFESIPDSFWYTVITATAVGYGDMYPKTIAGKFVGSILASVGLLLFCLPTPMLVNKFVECYYIRMTLTKDIDPHRMAVIKRMRETFVG